MTDIETKIHRTWIQLLLESGNNEIAAAALDADITELFAGYDAYGLSIDLPPSSFGLVESDQRLKEILCKTLMRVANGYISDQNGNEIENLEIKIRLKLLEVEENWKNIVRDLIVNSKSCNQARISEIIFVREKKKLFTYNEVKYASQSEIRIAQELENKKVLFFPLALAVRFDTGKNYLDHREVDFLICQDGIWGILEVSFHPNRYEKDSEKDTWFKKSGILCIQHYTSERCYQSPCNVVEEFLEILSKHK
jgi:hypothetical protein